MSQRFWQKVDKAGPVPEHCPELGPCWIWTGARLPAGYGRIANSEPAGPRVLNAHRVSWEMAHGSIPDGSHVLHRCDVPRCVRPDHLFLGDQAANVADMVAKGRHGAHVLSASEQAAKHWAVPPKRIEQHVPKRGLASSGRRREAIRLTLEGMGATEIARTLGVSRARVYQLLAEAHAQHLASVRMSITHVDGADAKVLAAYIRRCLAAAGVRGQ